MKTPPLQPRFAAIAVLVLSCAACSGDDTGANAGHPASHAEDSEAPGGVAAPVGKASTVEVEAGGTEFKPPVHPDRIPGGAWICDMPTVHYAAMEKGTGKCPLCGMTLRHVPVDPDEQAGHPQHEGHEGHETHGTSH